jgi:hypothetical protein
MARNKMEDVRDHIFLALERLNDEDCKDKNVDEEYQKAKAIANLANVIIQSAKVEIDFLKATGAVGTNSALFQSVVSENKQIG